MTSHGPHTLCCSSFEYGDYLCNVCISLFFVSCLPPGLALEDDVHGDVLSSLRFSPLLLVVDLDENGPRC